MWSQGLILDPAVFDQDLCLCASYFVWRIWAAEACHEAIEEDVKHRLELTIERAIAQGIQAV